MAQRRDEGKVLATGEHPVDGGERPVRLIAARICRGWAATSIPSIVAEPASAGVSVVRACSSLTSRAGDAAVVQGAIHVRMTSCCVARVIAT